MIEARVVEPQAIEYPRVSKHPSLPWPLVYPSYRSRMEQPQPMIYFDIAFDPRIDIYSVATWDRYNGKRPLSRADGDLPVSMTDMIIIFSPFADLWQINVHRSRGIRCIDIFRAIYDNFAEIVTRKELAYFGEDYIDKCQKIFRQRCRDSPGLSEYNRKCGMRRVDLLNGQRIFKGLRPNQNGPANSWILDLETPTK
ncbi:hypothetical protein BDQ12DRAFT_337106 [Crucibulum laeve]|uniref:DUF6699 domain-containing protein n=1 Tax=Crucibulum laeve TaxID=68775 RepID=A0A5C3LQ96_9AGAR|nr:hypothetical protein BDQ12DRAFT_337106 [Crucibulum laeve]